MPVGLRKIACVLILIVSVSVCKKDENDDSFLLGLLNTQLNNQTSYSYGGTSSPGDPWTFSLSGDSDGTFTAVNSESARASQFSGNMEGLENGFLKLTVTSSNTDNIPAGAVAYAVHAPGLAFFVAPFQMSAEDTTKSPYAKHVMALVPTGNCDFIGLKGNYVDWGFVDKTTVPNYGSAEFNGTNDSITIKGAAYKITDNSTVVPPDTVFTTDGRCNNGTVDFSGGYTGYSSSAGGMVLDRGAGNGGVVGFMQNNVTLSTLMSKSYKAGIGRFDTAGDTTYSFSVDCDGSTNKCIGAMHAGPETADLSAATFEFTFQDSANGSFPGTMKFSMSPFGTDTHTIRLIASESGGTVVGFLSGYDNVPSNDGPFAVVLISK